MTPKLIKTVIVLHPAASNAGPRIEKIKFYLVDGLVVELNYWYENGRLVKMS